jgi:hypothetical protein
MIVTDDDSWIRKQTHKPKAYVMRLLGLSRAIFLDPLNFRDT